MRSGSATVPIEDLSVSCYRVPTDCPNESDGTFAWQSTTLVVVEARAGGRVTVRSRDDEQELGKGQVR